MHQFIQTKNMANTQLYLPTLIPQWGIFAGIVLLTVGFVEKKDLWTRMGWIILIATGLAALYFNLLGNLNEATVSNEPDSLTTIIISIGWQTAAGGALAAIALLMFQLKKKRYPVLAVLTLAYFILTFFLYTKVYGNSQNGIKTKPATEQKP